MNEAAFPEPPTAEEMTRARLEQEHLRNELLSVRSVAAGWQKGVAGLGAAVIGLSLISADDVHLAPEGAAIATGVLLAVALGGSVAAAIFLMRASHGFPRLIRRSSIDPLLPHRDALQAVYDLRRGVVISLAALLAFCAAVGVLWYTPRDEPTSSESCPVESGACCDVD